ncbi:hypothetical protein E8E12_004518 [Didymella heteroderae]|uniref:Uncharacterized protein n=1 Tax=Didymella heteroderae TaxID=1769908 RepID=A0A9P4WS07_9PLEO|nr:hypothetical protein E8E12_004518 [Didymella heteroderae]
MAMESGSDSSRKGDVDADINYFPASGVPIPTTTWQKRYLGIGDEHTRCMTIHNVRQTQQTFDLNTNGFTFLKLSHKQRVDISSSEEEIRQHYYPELVELAKNLTGASIAFVFNHVVRAHSSPADKGKLDYYGRWQDIPAGHPHVDYCGEPVFLEGTKQELDLPPEIYHLYNTSSRYAYLGAWRPLRMLRKDPLAVCDATTVPESDYQIRLREFRSGVKSGNYVMSHAEEKQQHQWYYMSEMTPDEIVVFKGYDTDQIGPKEAEPRSWTSDLGHKYVLPPSVMEAPGRKISRFLVLRFTILPK